MKRASLIFIIFALLAAAAHASPYFAIDLTISRAIQSIHSTIFDLSMKAVSSIGSGRALPIAVIFLTTLIFALQLRLEALYLAISTTISLLAGSLTKLLVFRPRPVSSLVNIYKQLSDGSFPSSHTLTYTLIFGFLLYIAITRLKPSPIRYVLIALSTFLITSIGISRIYLGAHWASDVVGGYLFGALALNLTINSYKAHAKR